MFKNKPERLLTLEAGRGIAALMVLLFHLSGHLEKPKYFNQLAFGGLFEFGHAGVDFFFVLSGFIMLFVYYDDIGHPERIWNYVRQRLLRIFPAYWAVSALVMPVFFFIPSFGTGSERQVPVIIKSLFLFPQDGFPILPVAWTLQNELLFYMVFAGILLRRAIGWIVCLIWGAAIIGSMWMWTPETPFAFRFLLSPFNLNFLAGMCVAYIVRRGLVRQRAGVWVLLAGFGLFLVAAALELDTHAFRPDGWDGRLTVMATPYGRPFILERIMYGLASTCIVLGFALHGGQNRLRVPGALVLLGSASFSLYLIHFPLLSVLSKALVWGGMHQTLPVWLAFCIVACLTIVGSVLFHQWVEQPIIHLARQRASVGRRGDTSSEPAVSSCAVAG